MTVKQEGITFVTGTSVVGGPVSIADGADVAQGNRSDLAWVSGDGTVISLLKKIASAGGSAVSIADGADTVEGTLADIAVVTDAAGTVSGKLRGLIKWAFERMPASLGQKVMTGSLPVVLASDQSALAVTGPLTDAQLRATPVPVSAASLPLPTGAATEATLSALNTKVTAVDTTGKATEAKQDTQITSLANLDVALSTRVAEATFTTRINTQGQKLMASSTPVVIASDQSAIAVSGPLTDGQLRATPVPVSGPLTDAQLRASVVPISGTVGTKTDLTPSAPTAASVGVASALAVAANATRKGLLLVNTSVNRISLGFGSPAVLDSGATLFPGGVFSMDEYDFDLGAVNAIASAAASNLGIQEYAT